MKIGILIGTILSAASMLLSGCGGGGGGSSSAAPTVVSGVASKGQFVSGKVDIFGVDPVTSGKGTLLKTTSLDALGNYTADISPYTGPVLIEVTGKYKDEATGTQLDTTVPLRVAISNATGNVTAMVTPLTEMAVIKMNNVFTKTAVDTINANIAAVFKVEDITKTKPVDATDAAATATATEAEKNQSLVLAAVSQLMKNSGNKLDKVLNDMATDISGPTMADKSVAGFKTALFDFMSDTSKNKTGITDTATAPVNIGSFKIAHLKISTAGLAAGAKIGGIDFTFNLPVGVKLDKDAITNQVSSGVVVVSGAAAAAGTTSISLSILNSQALRTVLANAQGFDSGEFVNISCTIPTGVTATAADFTSAITASSPTVTDAAGATITGATLSTAVDLF